MLSIDSVADYLIERGIQPAGNLTTAWSLAGGVSNIVLAVDAGEQKLVVKQSLPQLRVETVWKAKQERTLNEARALSIAGSLTPAHVPEVIDVDDQQFCLVITRAPEDWTEWKRDLLAGSVDLKVASVLGKVLGTWHRATAEDSAALDDLDDPEAFDQLRVGPYYRTVAQTRPEYAALVKAVIARMTSSRQCLVHGDYSPKNILVGESGLWVVDLEVAHVGDPVFDVAFMLSHLILKSIHRPSAGRALLAAARTFLASYRAQTEADLDLDYLAEQIGCLLLARVLGKSPVEYLNDDGRSAALRFGGQLLTTQSTALSSLLDLMEGVDS